MYRDLEFSEKHNIF